MKTKGYRPQDRDEISSRLREIVMKNHVEEHCAWRLRRERSHVLEGASKA
jgi:hypothetical protein